MVVVAVMPGRVDQAVGYEVDEAAGGGWWRQPAGAG